MSRKVNLIIVHCSATPPDMDVGVVDIDRWHKEKGWDGIGYHFVIRRDGKLETGRDIEKIGAHAKGFNTNSVGVCMVGGVRRVPGKLLTDDNFTEEQKVTLVKVLKDLEKKYPGSKIIGHRDVEPHKDCPSFSVKDFCLKRGIEREWVA